MDGVQIVPIKEITQQCVNKCPFPKDCTPWIRAFEFRSPITNCG